MPSTVDQVVAKQENWSDWFSNILLWVAIFFFVNTNSTKAAIETIQPGSFIINMGITPQTVNNGLKPYGMLYDLMKNNNIIVKWVIGQTKSKDGIDFAFNGVTYKGGTFIIPARYCNAAVRGKMRSASWNMVIKDSVATSFNIDVTYTLKYTPKWTFDFANGAITQAILTAAGIPISNFPMRFPSILTGCDDLFILPHADPTWATHKYIRDYVQSGTGNINGMSGRGGWLWEGCHSVSIMEGLYNPLNKTQKLNMLSDSLVNYADHLDQSNNALKYAYPQDPIMQFMGIADAALKNGSEAVYLPAKRSGIPKNWRPTSKVFVWDSLQPNIPSLTAGKAALFVSGRAFGSNSNGMVLYQSSHDFTGSSTAQIAAQRAFLNFSFLASTVIDPNPTIDLPGLPMQAGVPRQYNVSLAPGYNPSDYTIFWTSSCGGTFSNNGFGSPILFTPASVSSTTPCTVTAMIIDECGRQFSAFDDMSITSSPPTAQDVTTPIIINNIGTPKQKVGFSWPLKGVDFDGVISSYTITSLPPVASGTLYYNNGVAVVPITANTTITPAQVLTLAFDPQDNYGGNATFTFTVTDNSGLVDATPATYTMPINPPPVCQDFISASIPSNSNANLINPLVASDNGTIATYTISTVPNSLHGTLFINGVPVSAGMIIAPAQANLIYFQPKPNYVGFSSFTYTATDNLNCTDPTPNTVTLQIVNQDPVAFDVSTSSINNPNGTGQTAIDALVATDADGSIVSYKIVYVPDALTEGSLFYNNGGVYTLVTPGQLLTPAQATTLKFDPVDGLTGYASFTYTAKDNSGLIDQTPATYNLPINIVPPIANNITNAALYAGNSATPILNMSGTDPDASNIIVNYKFTSLPSASQGTLYYTTGGVQTAINSNITMTPAEMATLKFDPTGTYIGNVVFNYTLTDNEGLIDLSDAIYTIQVVNANPDAFNVTTSSMPNSASQTAISALSSSDVDGMVTNYIFTQLPLASQGVLYVDLDGAGPALPSVVNILQSITLAQGAYLYFDPLSGFVGNATFTYTVMDNLGLTDLTPATYTIPVTTSTIPPTTNNVTTSAINLSADMTSILPFSGTDADGTVTAYVVNTLPPAGDGTLYVTGTPVSIGQIIPINQINQLLFDPSGSFTGTSTFTYSAIDNDNLMDLTPNTYSIPVSNILPIPSDISVNQVKTSTTTVTPPLNAEDEDGTIASFTIISLPAAGTMQVDLPGTGTYTNLSVNQVLTVAQSRRLRYISPATIGVQMFTFKATDNFAALSTVLGTYSIPVNTTAISQPPYVIDVATASLSAGAGPTAISALQGFAGGAALSGYLIVTLPPSYYGTLYYTLSGVVTPIIVGGTQLTVAQMGTLKFDPSGNFGEALTFYYTAYDANNSLAMNFATYTIPLTNILPTTNNVTNASIQDNAGPTFLSNMNGADADGTIKYFKITSLPSAASGILYLNGVALNVGQNIDASSVGLVQFDPNPSFIGNATFTYSAVDNLMEMDQSPATFTIPISNTAPETDIKASQVISNPIGTGVQSIPGLSGSDLDGSIIDFTITSLPAGGVLALSGVPVVLNQVIPLAQAGNLTYDPNDNYDGTTSFNYKAKDNLAAFDTTPAVYTIQVNTPPVTIDITSVALHTTDGQISLPSLIATDNGSIISYTIISLPPTSQGILYVGASVATVGMVISPAAISTLKFDPATTFTGSSFTYTATDNIGLTDVTPSEVYLPFEPIVFGNIYQDLNGITDNLINGVGIHNPSGVQLYVNVINAGGLVTTVATVTPGGSYKFNYSTSGTYTLRLSTTMGTIGSPAPATIIPANWAYTAENRRSNSGNDGTPDGILTVDLLANGKDYLQNVFGIEILPNSNNYSYTLTTPVLNGVRTLVAGLWNEMGALGGTDAEEGTLKANRTIKITDVSVMNGNVLFYDANGNNVRDAGESLTTGSIITNYDSTKLKVHLTGAGSSYFQFDFALADSAQKYDPTPARFIASWARVLPIELLSLTAENYNSTQSLLKWVTAREMDNDHFEIETSTDMETWTAIGQVSGHGTTVVQNSYEFIHAEPSEGVNYYRLKQVDFNGEFKYSDIRNVNFETPSATALDLLMYPNPASSNVNFKINNMVTEVIDLQIMNSIGEQVEHKAISKVEPTISINLSHLAKGMYTVVMTDKTSRKSYKLVMH